MDYKYIEQLLERYWQCETTLQEEAILRTFFSQPEAADIPENLRKYRDLFVCETEREAPLGDDFDTRILEKIGEALVGSDKYQYVLPFEFISLFLLACIIGGLVVSRNQKEDK